jgi:hypothetical protein
MAFEDLRFTSEKDASILELRQAAETALTDLEKEKKRAEGKLPPQILCLSIGLFHRDLLSTYFLFLSGLRSALGTSTTQVEVLQAAYDS